ncbi:hypothetical protein MMC13_005447 [Lambiella insularis]|nr:hypothetical protein [Lambiella insularis]
MRFLCLHGGGTSAEIFKTQTAAFRAKLTLSPPPLFDFVNGPHPAPAAPGIDLFYSPPYYSYIQPATPSGMADAYAWLRAYIAQYGPYDGVMTFSQGGALVAGMLLHQAVNTPHEPLPFECAVFICSGLPLAVLDDLGVPLSAKARDIDRQSISALSSQASSAAILAAGVERWRGVEVEGFVEGEEVSARDFFGLDFESFPRGWRIEMPTVHVYGRRDPRYPASRILAQFCREGGRVEFDHGAGHEIPRRKEVSEAIARRVEEVVGRVEGGLW